MYKILNKSLRKYIITINGVSREIQPEEIFLVTEEDSVKLDFFKEFVNLGRVSKEVVKVEKNKNEVDVKDEIKEEKEDSKEIEEIVENIVEKKKKKK